MERNMKLYYTLVFLLGSFLCIQVKAQANEPAPALNPKEALAEYQAAKQAYQQASNKLQAAQQALMYAQETPEQRAQFAKQEAEEKAASAFAAKHCPTLCKNVNSTWHGLESSNTGRTNDKGVAIFDIYCMCQEKNVLLTRGTNENPQPAM
jgi:hypothetical protein